MGYSNHRINRIAALVAAILRAMSALADDAAGLLRVEVAPDAEIAGEMPFAPFGDATPTNFLSGPFFGGGDGAAPDWLYIFPEGVGTNCAAAYSPEGWTDPETGGRTGMAAAIGDTLLFVPGESGDGEPFDAFLFGRAPGVASHSGSPRIRRMAVDPLGAFADIDIFTRGLATDFFSLDFGTNGVASSPWSHLGRHPGHPILLGLRDEALPESGGRLYLAADATRDTDGDGLPDEMERRIYGTSPYLADTDGDGIADAVELAWGGDPVLPDHVRPRQLFSESFERPEVVPGPVAGQREWAATGAPEGAVVQEESFFDGCAALEVSGARASHSVTGAPDIVWVDMREYPMAWTTALDEEIDAATMFFLIPGGHPAMCDGAALVTNTQFSVSGLRAWIRCTERLDFQSRTWDLYVDGVLVGENLGMRGDSTGLHEIAITGEARLDGISVTSGRPAGLSSDGDALPDEWEVVHFGDLSHDGRGDTDGDGMDDLAEWRAGTDPLAPNGDTDGDGLPDWWEAANGLNPFSADAPARAAFREDFERPAVAGGDIGGQNGWQVSSAGAASVQESVVHGGAAALEVRGGSREDGTEVLVSHAVRSRAEVLWMDLWQKPSPGFSGFDAAAEAFSVIAFDSAGHPVLSDGDAFVTNRTVSVGPEGRWVRCSCRYDFPNRKWDFYLDGVLVEAGLSMRGDTGSVHALDIQGGRGYFDDIYFGFARPEGLSSDGDALPDEWELRNFGTLDRDGPGDADGDGMADAEEFAAGTDPADADTDGDGLPDGWEAANGLDPLDASDAADDPDGDGLPSLDEYAIGTDPFAADTDGDGMPDGWEARNGTDPFADDALGDPDGDGLPNIAEMRRGTDWRLADTDGDGVSDGEEALGFLSDPLLADFDGTVTTNGVIHAPDVDLAVGTWYKCEGFVLLAGRCGKVLFQDDLVTESAGFFQLRMETFFKGAYDAELVCRVDGLRVGEARVPSSSAGKAGEVRFNTHWLPAGVHDLEFEFQNFSNSADFAFGDIAVCALGGPDSDGNGVADWIDSRHRDTGATRGASIRSKVSPFCLRGVSAELPSISCGGRALDARPLPDCGWWADVPLNAESATGTRMVYERGFKEEGVSIAWDGFNVLDETDTVLRRGDSLLLTLGGADGTISVNGTAVADGASPAIPFMFDSAGEYAVAGAAGGSTNALKVCVVECPLGGELPVWRGKRNSIRLTGKGLERMTVAWDGGAELVSSAPSGAQCVCSLSVPLFSHPTAFACELPNPDASVAGSAALRPFWIFYTLEGKYYGTERLEDGTRIVGNRISAFDLPESVQFKMTSSSGISFADGSGRLEFSARDFDRTTGDLPYWFFVPEGVNHPCQFLHGYFDGKEFAQ